MAAMAPSGFLTRFAERCRFPTSVVRRRLCGRGGRRPCPAGPVPGGATARPHAGRADARGCEVFGLLALMEIQASRLRARTGLDGAFIPLTEQDRARWD